MSIRTRTLATILPALLALLVCAIPALAQAAPRSVGAVVFSKSWTQGGEAKGGLFAAKDGRLNQLTEDAGDTEPSFSPDGRTIAFVRGGDLFSVRPDGSGQRQLTSGAGIDSRPRVSPDGKLVVFERAPAAGFARDLYTVRVLGGGLHQLTSGAGDDREPTFSSDGRAITFVRGTVSGGGTRDDLYAVKPSGADLSQLTRTAGVDEFAPRYFAGGIVYSRGESTPGAAAYADVWTMKRDGRKARALVAGVGSAYVEDVSADGHTVLFRRDQGLWVKRIGPKKARKLTQLPDNSQTSSVFSSDGTRIAAFVETEGSQRLVSIRVADGRSAELAAGYDYEGEEGDGTVIGPVIDWQPKPVTPKAVP